MIYIQTTIEIEEKDMEQMTKNTIADIEGILDDAGYPTTKEIKVAVLKETLKKIFEKELDN